MTLVTDILSRAARQCSVKAPTSWVSATQDTHVSLRDDFLLDTVDDLLERIDWPAPIGKTVTLTGDGTESLSLPADFKRLTRNAYAVYEETRTRRRALPVASSGEWEYLKEIGSAGAERYYRLTGYDGARSIGFYRALESGSTAIASYVSTVWLVNSGTEKSAFTDAADTVLWPRRLLETGIIWRFRERHGLPYEDKLTEYEALVARTANDRRGVDRIDMGGMRGEGLAFPPVPDFIPSS